MEGNGAYDQRKLQTQLGRPRNINTNLVGGNRKEDLVTSVQRADSKTAAAACIERGI